MTRLFPRIEHARQDVLVLRAVCLFQGALIVSTWPLWRSPPVFPQVPLLAAAIHGPGWIDRVGVVVLLVSLTSTIAFAGYERTRRLGLAVALACTMVLCVLDQHRLQPWAYHFMISAWVFIACSPLRSLRWLRLLIVSVYCFSALSKLDATFLETNGMLFVQTASRMIGLEHVMSPPRSSEWASLFALGELTTAILLAARGLRRVGIVAAVVLHLSLILLLGPWGLNHHAGVLIWNVAFLTQIILLFSGARRSTVSQNNTANKVPWWPPEWKARIMLLPVLLAILLPWTEPLGLWDSWLSWGLYSKRASTIDIFLSRDSVEQLPASIRTYFASADRDAFWQRLAMDRWSLDAVQAPLYPHERFQLGVGLALAELIPDDMRMMMAVRSSSPDRRSGRVTTRRWRGEAELQRQAKLYRWNARPRTQWVEALTATGGDNDR